MNNYNNYHTVSTKSKLQATTEKLFNIQYLTGEEGYEVSVDETYSMKAIIQKHVNPKNELLLDKKMLFLKEDMENVHWGSQIKSDKLECPYIVVGRPEYNGMYGSCVIRKANNKVEFKLDNKSFSYHGVLHVGKIYIDQSYVNDTNVFAEEDKRALVIKYDNYTNRLNMFSEVVVDNVVYSVVKVDDCVLREYGSGYGVIQVVLLRQAPSTLTLNFTSEVLGIMRYARLKERVYNSNARELLTLPNAINTGDYLTYNLENNEKRTYIVRSMVDEFENYDRTFIIICQKEVKFLDKNGNVIIKPMSFSDNRTKMNEKDTWFVVQDTSTVEGYIRLDEYTAQLSYADIQGVTDYVPNRFIIDGIAYRIVGTDRLSMDKLMTLKLVVDRIDLNFDNLELGIADYYRFHPKEASEEIPDIQGDSKIYVGETSKYNLTSQGSQQSIWSIEPSVDGVTLEVLDNKIMKLQVASNIKLIGQSITLKCITGSRVIKKDILIVGW